MKMPELLPPPDTMYRALVTRDPSFEGIFYAGVRTTGIFCRPTCTAKKPERVNVDFFATPSEALHSGYRPCLRCHPMDPDQPPPKLIARLRAEVDRAPDGRLTDKELAAMSIDPSTARRQFKRHYGMTFQAYHRARRMGSHCVKCEKVSAWVKCEMEVVLNQKAVFATLSPGFLANRRPQQRRMAACLPNASKRPLARCWRLQTTRDFVCSSSSIDVRWSASCRSCDSGSVQNVVPGEHRHLDAVRSELADYFSGKNLRFNVPLAPVGSPFQLRAWELLRSIPTGETRSYSWMAKKLGDVEMRRAVGRANGENMICIIIPCHRVIRADGSLCGYGGGLWRKKWLLDHERRFERNSDRIREKLDGPEAEQDYFAMQTFLGSVKNRRASSPPSRPTPLCFMPPKGTRKSRTSQQFTQTVPV